MDTLNIDKKKAINAYQDGSDELKKVLEQLFGVDTFRSKTVMERVKNFNDALIELGPNHPFVLAFQNTNLRDKEVADDNRDAVAYLKLRIITAALNEGWMPKLTKEERRYYPYFRLCSNEDIIRMSEKEESSVVNLPSGGVSYAHAYHGSAYVDAAFGSRLAFKTEELAEYAGKQFTELYADYLLNTNNA